MDLEANCQVIEKQTENNYENGHEHSGIIETPYRNLMLDRKVLRTEEKPTWDKLFLPQEVVWCEVWIGGFQRRHNITRNFGFCNCLLQLKFSCIRHMQQQICVVP